MNWRYKALAQQVLSCLPFGEKLNYFLQRKVTGTVPNNYPGFLCRFNIAQRNIETFRRQSDKPMRDTVFYEFGAGWDLIGPLSMWALGVDHQILVDIRRLARPDLISDTLRRLAQLPKDLIVRRPPPTELTSENLETQLLLHYGIEYRAPTDPSRTGLPANSVDCVTSTSTLEHVPRHVLPELLKELYRILKKDGLMLSSIDYQDHYAYFDKSISCYNFLRYGTLHWVLFNPSLNHQNRLRHKQYLCAFREASFSLVEEHILPLTEADLEILSRIPLAPEFSAIPRNELALRRAELVSRPQCPHFLQI